jgi:hypothetical protein
MTERRLLDAKDLQGPEFGLSRQAAYRVLRTVGVRITERRLVVLRSQLEQFLRGGDLSEQSPAESVSTGAAGSD